MIGSIITIAKRLLTILINKGSSIFTLRPFNLIRIRGAFNNNFKAKYYSKLIPHEYSGIIKFAEAIELPIFRKPIVSVIIPTYGKINYTLGCLASIAANLPQTPFEVIVVDDCSPDKSSEVLSYVKGIRMLCNNKNQGFIKSCNIGAYMAQGEFLYFLNNDIEVFPGWLDELYWTFENFPGTGLVGSKLIYPSGKLQEAGCIIWQDGSISNYGRNNNASDPLYNYAREVDYCSGASIMVPKWLFIEMGGFDEQYLPAYCEDSDLALKIRDKGYRIIYQPFSTVIHYEGITSGTDIKKGVKAFQTENMKKLLERWRERIKLHPPPGLDIDNAKDRMARYHALVVDALPPTPDQDSGSIDTYNIMLLLREMGFHVTFVPKHCLFLPKYTSSLQRVGIEVLYPPYIYNIKQHLKKYGDRYDLVFLFRPEVAKYCLGTVRRYCPKAKIIYNTVDLHFIRMMREAEIKGDQLLRKNAYKMRELELKIIDAVDIALVLSSKEIELLNQHVKSTNNIKLLPFTRHIKGTEIGFFERSGIVFIGGFNHSPNVDAVLFFVLEIMPLIRERLPGVCFYVVGSNPPKEFQKLEYQDVIIKGWVKDLESFLDHMRISVAPLRYGAGIKGKIATAMSVGLPVVATSIAAEGMSLTNGENVLLADNVEAFASAIVSVYNNEVVWNKLSKNGIEFAKNTWGEEAGWHNLKNILSDLGFKVKCKNYELKLYSSEVIRE